MKYISFCLMIALLLCLFGGCGAKPETAQIMATTLPVYQFTTMLCQGTDLAVTQLVTENVSCLHDYSLSVRQAKAVEGADLVILNGAGLEDFMADLLTEKPQVDASAGIHLLSSCHDHAHDTDHEHSHDVDAHIWLSPVNAMVMAQNICNGLKQRYPQHSALFDQNLSDILQRLQALLDYGKAQLSTIRCREMITFHDGFAYFAHCFDLHILESVEEESGSEASARELIELINLVRQHELPTVFTEINGADSAARIIAAEVHISIFALNMAMYGDDYFAAMYHNIDTIKEVMG